MQIEHAPVNGIAPVTLYEILRLRTSVFVVEQSCPYPELDGRDIEPGAELWWASVDAQIAATLRVLSEPEHHTIGRVVAAPAHRGTAIAAELFAAALADLPGRVSLHAQAPLERWYRRFGFVRCGPDFLEDGIPHTPMERPPPEAR